MKKLYFLLIAFAMGWNAIGQTITFPDANFKAKLLQPNVASGPIGEIPNIDANSDGEIQVSEAQAVVGLDVSNANISDLTGISNFTSLQYLNCGHNALT